MCVVLDCFVFMSRTFLPVMMDSNTYILACNVTLYVSVNLSSSLLISGRVWRGALVVSMDFLTLYATLRGTIYNTELCQRISVESVLTVAQVMLASKATPTSLTVVNSISFQLYDCCICLFIDESKLSIVPRGQFDR